MTQVWHSCVSQPCNLASSSFPKAIGLLSLALTASLPLILSINKTLSIQGRNSHLTFFLVLKNNDGLFLSLWSHQLHKTINNWATQGPEWRGIECKGFSPEWLIYSGVSGTELHISLNRRHTRIYYKISYADLHGTNILFLIIRGK